MESQLPATTERVIRDSPLPPDPECHTVFNPPQWTTLLSIADTIIPSIRRAKSAVPARHQVVADPSYDAGISQLVGPLNDPDRTALAENYLEENAVALPGFKQGLCRTIALYVPPNTRQELLKLLSLLNNSAFSFITTGSATPFHLQPLEIRQSILRSWETSYLSALRRAHRSLVALCHRSWIASSPTLPLILGMPQVPIHGKMTRGYPYTFIQVPPGENPEVIDTDVVIVGSGCGAGVAAKNLAEAGYRVIVVEKSYHFSEDHYPMSCSQGLVHMYANGGAEISDDGSTTIISGSTWGGGGTVNWSASLQTQSFVRQEWAKSGLDFFTSTAFQNSLDRVCACMGVSTDHIHHNPGNKVIVDGARKLGYTAKSVPQNTGNKEHDCGYCGMGCQSSVKQGPAVSFLADAARAGATFIEGYEVKRVLFGRHTSKGKKVVAGVQGIWRSRDSNGMTSADPVVKRQLIIKARKVVVSCGSLQSPLLLLRSGLKNPQIGRNLYLHPVTITTAVYEQETRPWEGSILTSLISDFENLHGTGYGTKIESIAMLPSFILPIFAWRNSLDYKLMAANLRYMSGFISLTRDKYPGAVYPDPVDGRCRITYTPSSHDRKNMVEGVIASAKIAYISGAKEIRTSCHAIPPFVRSKNDTGGSTEQGINDAAFQAWIKQFQRNDPLPLWGTSFASAHQMGTCRMDTSPKNGVVDPLARVWGTDGLYVMDASIFPSASGVNPMVTTMAISDWASRRLAEAIQKENSIVSSRL
ncbi:hypothetical protein LOZ39_005588 [Ophidiomyces ophidiicola]|nr:hypothetical protein LOZ49_004194 [Ophidiomyces ophidiicola]KAI2068882.1 hypothetical protein LOZ39_005588 [Ophidiomyces ophidiicola]KAI2139112.1 hypothetical protein LOZ29_002543 [Ophidiomyces ophidiicola]KAI2140059.1 hypothetical protein LOZ28_002998 [Ophidiomyces ophidiicola]KAI2220163.1 hypothetical protein LOZ15_002377 [Ophidiomyces ophidiicola]